MEYHVVGETHVAYVRRWAEGFGTGFRLQIYMRRGRFVKGENYTNLDTAINAAVQATI